MPDPARLHLGHFRDAPPFNLRTAPRWIRAYLWAISTYWAYCRGRI